MDGYGRWSRLCCFRFSSDVRHLRSWWLLASKYRTRWFEPRSSCVSRKGGCVHGRTETCSWFVRHGGVSVGTIFRGGERLYQYSIATRRSWVARRSKCEEEKDMEQVIRSKWWGNRWEDGRQLFFLWRWRGTGGMPSCSEVAWKSIWLSSVLSQKKSCVTCLPHSHDSTDCLASSPQTKMHWRNLLPPSTVRDLRLRCSSDALSSFYARGDGRIALLVSCR